MTGEKCWRCGNDGKRVVKIDGRCKSEAACSKRLRERVGIRVVLANPPTATAVDEAARVAREVRNAYYRYGLCTACGVVPHSAGRPRCNECHRAYLVGLGAVV